jgi:hypothetical protein
MSAKPRPSRVLTAVGWVGAAIVLAAALAACSRPATQNGDPAKLQQEAQAALARWDAAVAAAGGESAFVAVGELTLMIGGDWGPDQQFGYNAKVALMSGDFEAAVSLPSDTPPDGQVRWPNGSTRTVGLISAQQALADMKAEGAAAGPCKDCVPLKVTGAQVTTGNYETARGPVVAPAWEFTLEGTPVKIQRIAVSHLVEVVPPAFDQNNPAQGISIRSATGTAGGLTLTVTFEGASADAGSCGSDYSAQAVESKTAVVVIVTEHPHFGVSLACSAVGYFRTADATLSAPLGNRTVLEVTQGMPVSVTLTP